ncbi:hypothetical protein SAMN05421690_11021 [Nitrosomonas sp. Nm51]|uniref:hypothetical protein n=1 Tax=Nitrosomonas sp. Nm51 TaxID=133720 RepID=UPI0008BBDF05|nr:hypothetical protein [Nitrosomonas sp. Nm51]SER84412.1 hypothetical protein SAMN05421690_11021 [Nitrosomonas sp. Nm51]
MKGSLDDTIENVSQIANNSNPLQGMFKSSKKKKDTSSDDEDAMEYESDNEVTTDYESNDNFMDYKPDDDLQIDEENILKEDSLSSPSSQGKDDKNKSSEEKGDSKKRKMEEKCRIRQESKSKRRKKEKHQISGTRFTAWNLNHFGKEYSMDGQEILSALEAMEKTIDGLGDDEWAKPLKDLNQQIVTAIETADREYIELPSLANPKEVMHLIGLIKEMKQKVDKIVKSNKQKKKADKADLSLNKSLRTGDEKLTSRRKINTLVADVLGSIKKYYTKKHIDKLLRIYPDLIVGLNEVNEGVDYLNPTQTGPRLQSLTITLSEVKEKKSKKKEKEYEEVLNYGQVEYYPIKYNKDRYEYLGHFLVTGEGEKIEKNDNEMSDEETEDTLFWTKYKSSKEEEIDDEANDDEVDEESDHEKDDDGYSYEELAEKYQAEGKKSSYGKINRYRPIVVHCLKKKKQNYFEKDEPVIWYGIIHTTPYGSEFSRKKIYQEQMKEAIAALEKLAASEKARLIIGGDYYVGAESLVESPENGNLNEAFDKKGKRHKGNQNELRNLRTPDDENNIFTNYSYYNLNQNLEMTGLQDLRSVTGTNKNKMGLQSADYFIVSQQGLGKKSRTGLIRPGGNTIVSLESLDQDISKYWMQLSDHLPVMLELESSRNNEGWEEVDRQDLQYINLMQDLQYAITALMLATGDTDQGDTKQEVDSKELEDYTKRLEQLRKLRSKLLKKDEVSAKGLEEISTELGKVREQVSIPFIALNRLGKLGQDDFEEYRDIESSVTTTLYSIWEDIVNDDAINNSDEKVKGVMDEIQKIRLSIKNNGLKKGGESLVSLLDILEKGKEWLPASTKYKIGLINDLIDEKSHWERGKLMWFNRPGHSS